MAEIRNSEPRPLKVFVRSGSKAEWICRGYSARRIVAPQKSPPLTEVIAPGFTPHPELNLHDRRGKVITDLVYTNFYVGGSAWSAQDRDNIDNNLAKAMSDQELNNVLVQYFRVRRGLRAPSVPRRFCPGLRLTAFHSRKWSSSCFS